MKNQVKFMTVLSAAAIITAAAPNMTNFNSTATAFAAAKGWAQEETNWYFYDEDGYKETSTWKKKGSDWLYLNETGDVAVNQRIDEYYVSSDGRMVKNQWVSAEGEEEYDTPDSPGTGNWHYFGKDGKIVISKWMTIGDKTYYFGDEGQMMTGLVEINGETYYLGDENDGSRKTGWILLEDMTHETDDEEIWCYLDENGKMIKDQMDRKIGDYYYTFIDGQMQTGWVNLIEAGFVKPAVAPATDSDASASETAALSLKNFRYYDALEGGRRAIGWYTIEGAPGLSESDNTYTFYFKNGVAFHAAKPGLELFTINSKKYAFNEYGEMQTGLQQLAGDNGHNSTFYFNENGEMMTGKQTIYDEDSEENQTWYFITKGSLKGQGFHGERENQVYLNGLLQKADAELRYKAVTVGEKQYLVNTGGSIQKSSSASTSTAKPELGKGFKDIKDTNDTIWTVDSAGIIQ
ncbi:MAG: cell wall-binding protein [Clostridium sp.]